jgi:predicted transcriptional regulator
MDLDWQPKAPKAHADCPFCDGDHKFTIDTRKSLFRCVVCDAKGNSTTFLRKLHEAALQRTTLEDYQSLATLRGLTDILPPMKSMDTCVFRHFGIALSPITGEWLIPGYDPEDRLRNLYRYVKVAKGKYRTMSTPTMNLYPFGTTLLTPARTNIFICEGPWDALALYSTLYQLRKAGSRYTRTLDPARSLLSKYGVVGVPGANIFPKGWFSYFPNKHLHICFDNDHPRTIRTGQTIQPGPAGATRIASLANGRPGSISLLNWGGTTQDAPPHTTSLADGYDISDLIKDQGPVKALPYILAHQIKPPTPDPSEDSKPEDTTPSIEPLTCTSFEDLLSHFKDLHITRLWRDCFAVMLATIVSTRTKGNPLWMRIIGPPSSGKTLLAECMSASKEHVWALSTFSGFVSGFKGRRNDDGETEDSSLIPLMNGKCLIVKDGDTLMSNDGKDRILAELRDLFDGVTRAHYRNQESHVYEDIHTSIILCGTNQLRQLNRANLGERFLDMEIADPEARSHYARAAATHALQSMLLSFPESDHTDKPKSAYTSPHEKQGVTPVDLELQRKRATLGFLQYLHSNMTHVYVSDKIIETVLSMAEFLAFMRARVHKEELDTAPEIEMPARIVTQLVKLATCLSIVLGEDKANSNITRIIRRVVMFTAKGRQLDATLLLYDHQAGLNTESISNHLKVSESTAHRITADMKALGIVENIRLPRHGRVGRPKYVWRLTNELRTIVGKALSTKPKPKRTFTPATRKVGKSRSKSKPT